MKALQVVTAVLLAFVSATVIAQQIPGLPVKDVSTEVDVTARSPDAVEAPTNKEAAAAQVAAELESARALAEGLAAAKQAAGISDVAVKPAPSAMSVMPGVNTIVPVALNHLNRFLTPFPNPVAVITSQSATYEIRGRIVYVATSSTEPLTLYIHDESDPVTAFSLTLLPRDLPPASLDLTFEGETQQTLNGRVANDDKAEQWEASQPFVGTIKQIFRSLALGKVPDGYGLTTLRGGHALMPRCSLPGIEVSPQQLLTGHSILTIVSRVRNVGYADVEVVEAACEGEAVLAVAAWPHSTLMPGAETELYIALRRPTERGGADRPSVLAGAR